MRPDVEPAVMAALVRSTVAGEHTSAGSLIISTGVPGVDITMSADFAEVHPDELVTVKLKVPVVRPVIVFVVPVPVVVTFLGICVMVHDPVAGRPLKTTLPEGTVKVGCVTVPTTGASGVGGCPGMTTFEEGTERHPSAVVTVKLYVPRVSPEIVVLVPVPVVVMVPGYLIRVHVPVDGSPVSTTLPVASMHEGGVIVPTVGACGIPGWALITTLALGDDTHPVEFVTVKV